MAWLKGKAGLGFLCVVMPFAAMAEELRILALGDSLTQGYGLIESEGFVPQLDAWLEAQGAEVAVINGGVSGDTSAGGAARVDWSLTPDVDAMIVTLGGNDLLRGIDPDVTRDNIKAILSAAQAKSVEVLLVGMQAPGNYGPEYKQAFDSLYPELAEDYGVLYVESFFDGIGTSDPAQARVFFQDDGIHPNAEGVAKIVEGLGPRVLDLIDRVGDPGA
ncbi:arylesterase [Roseovarius sp. A21]|uniref:Arylesterase n=1 Tax=Roseovarius bejariae TaxID=2576383 RepID=A0A844CVU2_9RHOB|nr:arylesterase [Roseovarius bejariae]MRU15276.1 arylesterase [Roseovarius bejariae]